MSDRVKVSVALCTYNGQRYVQEQLDSFVQQTRQPDELIVNDDCSDDDTLAILQTFCNHAPFHVEVHSNERNLGVIRNFGRAINRTSGNIIFLSDQNDIWYPEKIATMTSYFQMNQSVGLVYSDAQLVDAERQTMGATMWQTLQNASCRPDNSITFEQLLQGNCITGAIMAFRHELKSVILPLSDHLIHDYWIALLATLTSYIVAILQPLVDYRQHNDNQIGLLRAKPFLQRIQQALSIPIEQYHKAYLSRRDLASRIESMQIDLIDSQRKHLEEQLAHWHTRATLPADQWEQLPIIFREIRDTQYQKYSRNGLVSALRDVVAIRRK